LYAVRRFLYFTECEWDGLPWSSQRAYLAGLDEDPEVPFSFRAADTQVPGGPDGPRVRQIASAAVPDVDAMIADLEAERSARRPGGGRLWAVVSSWAAGTG
jgi:hypothetical protein